MKALVVDDEKMARKLLIGLLNLHCPEIEILEECANLAEAVKAIRKHQPDVVFLDIEMPGQSGLDLPDFFDDNETNFYIIFITAYQHYALEALKRSAIDYLLKPVDVEELKEALQRVEKRRLKERLEHFRAELQEQGTKKIAVPTLNSIYFLALDDLMFFKGDGSYTHIYLKDDSRITASRTLKHFENMIQEDARFFRCHKSYLVNLNYVNEYVRAEGGYLLLQGKQRVEMSSDKLTAFLALMAKAK